MKVAFITGITGQDGSYLSELLLEKEYIVFGMIRKSSLINTERINHIYHHSNLKLRYGDLTDSLSIRNIILEIDRLDPERVEVYNLGAQSHVQHSFTLPIYTGEVDALGVTNVLEMIKQSDIKDRYRLYQASTSELYGDVLETPQNEDTPFNPQSPYAVAKQYGFNMIKLYREAFSMYACTGILFNHESPRRGHNFVTRKITRGLGAILRGEQKTLKMGNITSLRDWGHAKDYVYGMWLMLQQEKPRDYVLATGEQHTVKSFIEKTFALKGIDIEWIGSGLDEVGVDKITGKKLVEIDEQYFRPAEVQTLLGDSKRAQIDLGWEPKITYDELVLEMVEHDCN